MSGMKRMSFSGMEVTIFTAEEGGYADVANGFELGGGVDVGDDGITGFMLLSCSMIFLSICSAMGQPASLLAR